MKVYIGPYKNWFGPYQLAELLCFWVKDVKNEYGIKEKPEWVHKFGNFLATGYFNPNHSESKKTLLYKFLLFIDYFKVQRIFVKIDRWDTWSMDNTLAHIILPMLKQLKETKHGSALVDMEDVPEHLRGTTTEDWDDQTVFNFYTENVPKDGTNDIHARWEWVLNEMIFAFEHLVDNTWEDKYSSGEMDHYSEPCEWDEMGNPTMYRMKEGPNHTYKCDYGGLKAEWDRIDNGLRLFGKYYRGLWD